MGLSTQMPAPLPVVYPKWTFAMATVLAFGVSAAGAYVMFRNHQYFPTMTFFSGVLACSFVPFVTWLGTLQQRDQQSNVNYSTLVLVCMTAFFAIQALDSAGHALRVASLPH